MPENQLKDVRCSNKQCGEILCQTDGAMLIAPNVNNDSNNLSVRKKRKNLLYCVHCHRYTHF